MFAGTAIVGVVAADIPPLHLEIVAETPGGSGTTVGVAAEDLAGWRMAKKGFVHSPGSAMEL